MPKSPPPKAFVDTSVMLRHIVGERGALPLVRQLEQVWMSELLRIEALRTIDRLRIQAGWPDAMVALRIQTCIALLAAIQEVPLQTPILRHATQPFPTVVRTLDALHIATAVLLQQQLGHALLFLTHDRQQAVAARAAGFTVTGV